ncbi:hypothetical protein HDV05_005690 [Chytridiales sp. JEL 0842]|nr:hypothetical protein HDV05_005690 [Chytridiales sp. JEL 0842]
MVSFKSLILTAALAFSSLTLASPEPAVVAARAPKCEVVNWNDFSKAIQAGNFLVNLAEDSGLIQDLAGKLDPLDVNNLGLDFPRESVKVLGKQWDFDLKINDISLSGLNTIDIAPLNITSPTSLLLGGSLSNLLVNKLTFTATVTQQSTRFLGKDWCFAWKFWQACKPRQILLNTQLQLLKASVEAVVDVQIMKCGGNWFDKLLCRVQSGWDFVKSLFNKDSFTTELLQRVKSAKLTSLDVQFDEIKNLDVDILGTGDCEDELIDFAVELVRKASNKFGPVQKKLEETINFLGLKLANYQISKIASNFQSSCVGGTILFQCCACCVGAASASSPTDNQSSFVDGSSGPPPGVVYVSTNPTEIQPSSVNSSGPPSGVVYVSTDALDQGMTQPPPPTYQPPRYGQGSKDYHGGEYPLSDLRAGDGSRRSDIDLEHGRI